MAKPFHLEKTESQLSKVHSFLMQASIAPVDASASIKIRSSRRSLVHDLVHKKRHKSIIEDVISVT